MTTKTWRLFLDDERFPTSDLGNPVIARDCAEAIELVNEFGIPELISFDHDLGFEHGNVKPSAMSFLHWLIDQHLDGKLDCSRIKRVIVHSANPPGAANIASLWNSFAKATDISVKAELRPRTTLYN